VMASMWLLSRCGAQAVRRPSGPVSTTATTPGPSRQTRRRGVSLASASSLSLGSSIPGTFLPQPRCTARASRPRPGPTHSQLCESWWRVCSWSDARDELTRGPNPLARACGCEQRRGRGRERLQGPVGRRAEAEQAFAAGSPQLAHRAPISRVGAERNVGIGEQRGLVHGHGLGVSRQKCPGRQGGGPTREGMADMFHTMGAPRNQRRQRATWPGPGTGGTRRAGLPGREGRNGPRVAPGARPGRDALRAGWGTGGTRAQGA